MVYLQHTFFMFNQNLIYWSAEFFWRYFLKFTPVIEKLKKGANQNIWSLDWIGFTKSYLINLPHWIQDVNWSYIRRSEDFLEVVWTSYVRPVYVICSGGKQFENLKMLGDSRLTPWKFWRPSSTQIYIQGSIVNNTAQ